MEEKNEITLFNQKQSETFCSVVAKTEKEKKNLFNALETCDNLLNDCIGTEIELKDVYCEKYNKIDDETGEVFTKYRTILFDKDGKSYATGSYGIYNILRKIFTIYGTPQMWESPLKVKVAKRPIGNGKSTLTLVLI